MLFQDECTKSKTLKGCCLGSLQAAITKYLRQVVYKQQKFVSHISGGWKSEIRMPSGMLSWVADFSHGRRSMGALLDLFYKSTSPSHEGSTLVTKHLPKTLPPNTFTLGIRILR